MSAAAPKDSAAAAGQEQTAYLLDDDRFRVSVVALAPGAALPAHSGLARADLAYDPRQCVRSGGRRTDATAPAPDSLGRRLLLAVECRSMSASFVLAAGESRSGTSFNIFGNAVTIKVAGRDTGGTFALMHDVTPPLGGPPLHRHRTDVEVFSVVDGRFVFELDGDRHEAGPGATVLIQPGVVHLYQNVGDHPGRMLIHIAPAGLDAFFAELDALLRASTEPDMPAIAALHDKYGMDLLGPPLSARS